MQSIYTNEVHGGDKMYWDRSQLKQMARNALHGSYWKSVLVAFLLGLTSASFASSGSAANAEGISDGYYSFEHYLPVILTFVFFAGVLALALRIFLLRPLEVGCRRYFLEDIIRPAELDCLKAGFSGNYRNVVWVMFCRDIFIFLWTLLLIVPGIVKSYEYRMVPYVLAENPDLSREEAFALSKRMMDGDKMNAFILDLSFIGWAILTILTFGLVGIFYYQPYLALTDAALYQTLKKKVDRFFDDGGYNDGGYNNGGYTGGGYADGSNNNGGYNNGGYNGGGYGDSGYGDSGYGDGGYGDGGYNNGGYGDSGNSYGGYNNDGYGDSGNSYGGYNGGGYGDGGYNNGGYTDGYNNGSYNGGGYAGGSNNNSGYNNGSYNGGGYGDSGNSYGGYNNGGYGDSGNSYGSYNNGGYGDGGNNYGGYNNGGYGDGSNNYGGYNNGGYSGGGYGDGGNNNGAYTGSDYSAGNDYSNHYPGSFENSDYTVDSSWEENKNPWAEDGRKNNPWEDDT